MADVGAEFARRTVRSLWRRSIAANLAGLFLIVSVMAAGGWSVPRRASYVEVLVVNGLALVTYFVVAALLAYPIVRRNFRPIASWLGGDGERPDTRQVAAQPFLNAVWSAVFWLAAGGLTLGLNLSRFYEPGLFPVVRYWLGVVMGMIATMTLIYLLQERAMRPVVARVLAGQAVPRVSRFGILRRLLVSWTLGSAVFFFAVLAVPIDVASGDVSASLAALRVASVGGLAFGLVTTIFAARAVGDPIRQVRRGLEGVERGELDPLAVDDGGEVGRLQAGFNRMVEGLRERERLHDLFGEYVGPDVAGEALRGDARAGVQAEASALFIDVIGSSVLAQERPAREVVRMLNALFEAVVRAVGAEEGWVNRFVGDGALCVFGVPRLAGDHAARALRTARALHAELGVLAERFPGLDAAIGVSSGEIVAGDVGGEKRHDYTVIGQPVNEASRLTDQAKVHLGRVLASERTVLAAGDEARAWRECATLRLRGLSGAVRAFEPVG